MPVRQQSRSDAILALMRAQHALSRASLKGQRSAEEVAAVRKKIISDLQPRPKLVDRPKAVQAKRTAVGNHSPLRHTFPLATGGTRPAPAPNSTPREPTPPVDELRQLADLMRCAGRKRFTGTQLLKFVTNSRFRSAICQERMRLKAEAAARRRAPATSVLRRADNFYRGSHTRPVPTPRTLTKPARAETEKEKLKRKVQETLATLPPLGRVHD